MLPQEELSNKKPEHLAKDLAVKYMLARLINYYSLPALSSDIVISKVKANYLYLKNCLPLFLIPVITSAITIAASIVINDYVKIDLNNGSTNLAFMSAILMSIAIVFNFGLFVKIFNLEQLGKWNRFRKSVFLQRQYVFFKDFNINLMGDFKGETAKIVDFMNWVEFFIKDKIEGNPYYLKKDTNYQLFMDKIYFYKSLVYGKDILNKNKILTPNKIAKDLSFVLEYLVSVTSEDFKEGGVYFKEANDRFKHKALEESRFRVKFGLSSEKYQEQSNSRLMDLIGKNDI